MRQHHIASIIVATLALGGCTTGSGTEGGETLNTSELKSLLIGKRVSYGAYGRGMYYADGRFEFSRNGTMRGRYSISNNQVCVSFDTGANRCDQFVKRGNDYYFVSSVSGTHRRLRFI